MQLVPLRRVIARFDCKLALLWSPLAGRFAFDDGKTKYYTTCSYDDYTWHHALVSINDAGVGSLIVDGESQMLETANNPEDLQLGFTPHGTTFSTLQYPNKCAAAAGKRRSLLQASNATTSNVTNGTGASNTTSNATSPAAASNTTSNATTPSAPVPVSLAPAPAAAPAPPAIVIVGLYKL
jgi:hypothetical protein